MLWIVFKEAGCICNVYRIYDSRTVANAATPPRGHIWNILNFDSAISNVKFWFFRKIFSRFLPFFFSFFLFFLSDLKYLTSTPWRAAVVRCVARCQAMTQRFWRTFLAQREMGTKTRHCSAATGHRHSNSQSDRKANESRWVICMERKVHLTEK